MQWSGQIWAAERPDLELMKEFFPNCLYNYIPEVDRFGYGPYINGFLQARADRDAENGPIVNNYAMANNMTNSTNGTNPHE